MKPIIRLRETLLAALAAAFLPLLPCGCEGPEFWTGKTIKFKAETGYRNGISTRTQYSGSLYNVESRTYERIDWVPQADMIRIHCEEAAVAQTSDYIVTGRTDDGKNSRATLATVKSGNLEWGPGGTHYFYALYPSPLMTSEYGRDVNDSEAVLSYADGNGRIDGVIPAVQPYAGYKEYHENIDGIVRLCREYKPDMNYAYMYGFGKAEAGLRSVSLAFKPLMTAFMFTLKAGDAAAGERRVTGFRLKSGATGLAGAFSATLTPDGNYSITTSGTESEILIPIREEDQRNLSPDDILKLTVLALPVDQDMLSIEVLIDGGEKRTLDLRYSEDHGGEWLQVEACKKVFIRNLGVPGEVAHFDYTFVSTDPEGVTYSGGPVSGASVTSYKTRTGSGEQIPVAWEADGYFGSYEDALSGSNPLPMSGTALTAFSPVSSEGSLTPETLLMSCQAAAGTQTWIDPGELADRRLREASPVGSPSSYWNLSNPAGGGDAITESANTYIVNAPGYYRIPLVMGNGVKGNSPRSVTYSESNFMDYKDMPVSSPYLQKSSPSARVPAEAFVVWEDRELVEVQGGSDFILPGVAGGSSSITVTGAGTPHEVYWLNFHVPAETIGQGLACLAVRDGDGDVMWSWLVWVTDYVPRNYPAYDPAFDLADVACTYDAAGHVAGFMPRNLGWVESGEVQATVYPEAGVYVRLRQAESHAVTVVSLRRPGMVRRTDFQSGYGPYYQFGRKDPLMDGYDLYLGADYIFPSYSGTVSMGETIRQPAVHFSGNWGAPYDWCSDTGRNNWWCAGMDGNRVDCPTVKTIYDPCPAGYCLPSLRVFFSFRLGPTGQTPNGYAPGCYYNGYRASASASTEGMYVIGFPATGYMEGTTGQLARVGTDGYCWTAATASDDDGYYFRFGPDWVDPEYTNYRKAGCGIRPQVEQ